MSNVSPRLAMKVAEALKRLMDMHVPGATEAVALMPKDPNAILDVTAVAAPILLSATYVGASPTMDEAARLTDLSLPTSMQKRYALLAMFELGKDSWSVRGVFDTKRLSAEAKRIFEGTLVGFVFFKNKRLMAATSVFLVATLACLLLPMIIRMVASHYLEMVASYTDTSVQDAGKYIVASRLHEMTYGLLKKVLDTVKTHAEETAADAPELTPFTLERIRELSGEDATFFAQYDIITFRALADHVDECVQDWIRDQNGSDLATRILAKALTFTLVVIEPIAQAISRLFLLVMACLAVSIVVAITRQSDVYLFENDIRSRRTVGRIANAVAFVVGAVVMVYAAWKMHSEWYPTVATLAVLISAKQFFAVWDHKPS